MCAEYCEQTGRLRILQAGTLLREWFPPNSWMAIASVAGARNWGARPDLGELRALLENQMSLLRVGYVRFDERENLASSVSKIHHIGRADWQAVVCAGCFIARCFQVRNSISSASAAEHPPGRRATAAW